MKAAVTIVLFALVCTTAKAQSRAIPYRETGVAMGLSGGVSSKQGLIGTLSVGAMLPSQNLISINMVILSDTRNAEIPTIFEARAARFINSIELYGGLGYHIAGSGDKVVSNPNTGLRPAYGVIKHFQNSPWIVGAGMSGSIFSLQIGLFGIR